jgi:hypothetical protein
MAFSYTTTGVSGDSPEGILHGEAYLVGGTWAAGGDATGTITTGGSKVLACGVTNSEVVSECPKVEYNTAADGQIKITPTDTTNNTGNWWAIVIP